MIKDRDNDNRLTIKRRIALDVDGVLCNFTQGLIDKAVEMGRGEYFPSSWEEWREWRADTDNATESVWDRIKEDTDFWLSLAPFDVDVEFQPVAYVTARPIPSIVTQTWLVLNKFPDSEVVTVGYDQSKVRALRELGVEVYVDDRVENYLELKEAGFRSFLFDRPWNQEVDAREDRIFELKEICRI